jgi:Domain of unknown function (DUF4326)
MNRPKRIQRRRAKGWRMPENAVYVGRPTEWGNPWRASSTRGAECAVANYREWLCANLKGPQRFRKPIEELRGKDLACWCPLNRPCHADVLLQIANQAEPTR